MLQVRGRPVKGAEVIQKISQRNRERDLIKKTREPVHRIINAGQQYKEIGKRPGADFRFLTKAQDQDADNPAHQQSAKKESRQKNRGRPPAREIKAKRFRRKPSQQREDDAAANDPDQPRPGQIFHDARWRQKSMLDAFRPNIMEDGVGHVQLADLKYAETNRTRQDKSLVRAVQLEKTAQQTDRQHPHDRPEKHFDDGKDVAPGKQPVAIGESENP